MTITTDLVYFAGQHVKLPYLKVEPSKSGTGVGVGWGGVVESLISLLTSVGVQQKVYLDVCVCVWGGGGSLISLLTCARSVSGLLGGGN